MLTSQWTRKLSLLQQTAPAELAARLIHAFLDDFPDIDSEQYFVIDFCSGAGGEHISIIRIDLFPFERRSWDVSCRDTQ
jgi:hypothetical protein